MNGRKYEYYFQDLLGGLEKEMRKETDKQTNEAEKM
jgi:hypothetical protein